MSNKFTLSYSCPAFIFDNNNLYVLNKKDRNALVYRDSMGTISRLTRDMFRSDEEFEYWKKWSDEDYHNEEKERHVFADNTLYIDWLLLAFSIQKQLV